jgi:hypothetical protein
MTTRQKIALKAFGVFVATVLATACLRTSAQTVKAPVDPGVRGGAAGAGNPLNNLTADEKTFFQDGFTRFIAVEVVQGGSNNGLGPRFNSNQCLSCHAQPAPGGTSPAQNPLIAVATLNGAKNMLPWFITAKGPVREARFSGIRTELTMARCTTSSSSPAGATPRGVISPNPTFCRLEIRSPAKAEIQTSSFASPPRSLGPDSLKPFPTRRFSPISRPTHPREGTVGHFRSRQRAPERQCESQCKRRNHYAFRMEGTEQIPAHVLERGVQRGDGNLEPTVPARARRDSGMSLHRHTK